MGTASCIGGDPGATACMKMIFFGVLGKGGVAGAGEGRKRPNRPTNCHKGTILRTATKALFGALVGGAFLKIRCSVVLVIALATVNMRLWQQHVSISVSLYKCTA